MAQIAFLRDTQRGEQRKSVEESTKSGKEDCQLLGDFEPEDRWEMWKVSDLQVPFLFRSGLRREEVLRGLWDGSYMVATGLFYSWILGSVGTNLFLLKGCEARS